MFLLNILHEFNVVIFTIIAVIWITEGISSCYMKLAGSYRPINASIVSLLFWNMGYNQQAFINMTKITTKLLRH